MINKTQSLSEVLKYSGMSKFEEAQAMADAVKADREEADRTAKENSARP